MAGRPSGDDLGELPGVIATSVDRSPRRSTRMEEEVDVVVVAPYLVIVVDVVDRSNPFLAAFSRDYRSSACT